MPVRFSSCPHGTHCLPLAPPWINGRGLLRGVGLRQPGNTVSSLDFLLVGWLICRHARRHGYLHLVLLANPDLSRKFYALQSFACCVVVEGILFFTQKEQPDYRWFGAFWLSFLLGYGL